tara:strand:+ start:1229 stop:1369 length:141 start_codon:yes stop_codon:yes gene_type:complete
MEEVFIDIAIVAGVLIGIFIITMGVLAFRAIMQMPDDEIENNKNKY